MITSSMATPFKFQSARGQFDLRGGFLGAMILLASVLHSEAQVELKTYADDQGYLNVRTLTCTQLISTFQEDADYLGVWYSGWYNGLAKRHSFNLARTREGIHQVIVYCKANPDKKITQAIDFFLKNNPPDPK
jgi:HdeA/HdeB family